MELKGENRDASASLRARLTNHNERLNDEIFCHESDRETMERCKRNKQFTMVHLVDHVIHPVQIYPYSRSALAFSLVSRSFSLVSNNSQVLIAGLGLSSIGFSASGTTDPLETSTECDPQ